MIKVRPKYKDNPFAYLLPGKSKLVGIGGDVTVEHTPRPTVIIPEATQEEYQIFWDARLLPAALYEVKEKAVKPKKETKEQTEEKGDE